MEMKKKKNSGLGYCILGVAGKLLKALKKKIIFFCVQGRNWNGYCQFPELEHDLVLRS